MSTFEACQAAYDNMLPPEYYEIDDDDYHMYELPYDELDDIATSPICYDDDDVAYQKERKRIAWDLMNKWPKCDCCGEPLARNATVLTCQECAERDEDDYSD